MSIVDPGFKKGFQNPDIPALPDIMVLTKMANDMFPGMQMFARDVNLKDELAQKYIPGLIISERGFTDASSRFMGMVTSHRYVILSNHMRDFSAFEHGTNWGLHVANAYSHFKVLGQCTHQGKTAIFLLHLPDDDRWKLHKVMEYNIVQDLYEQAVERFKMKCLSDPVPELTTDLWLARCASPLGMDNNGNLFPLEEIKLRERKVGK